MYSIILAASISAVVAVAIYAVVTNLVIKTSIRKRREAAVKEAEAEGEMIKKERILQAKESSYSSRANTTVRSTSATRKSPRASSAPSRSSRTCKTSSANWKTNSARTTV